MSAPTFNKVRNELLSVYELLDVLKEMADTSDDVVILDQPVRAADFRELFTKEARKRIKRACVKLDKLEQSTGGAA